MREIKFRARKEDAWVYFKVGFLAFFDDGTVQQYTGLKDKNGVEIYEGDIVRLRFHEAPDGESFENGQIKWHEGSAALKWWSGEPSDLNNYWLTQADSKYREVIGNIYENPELLKETS